MQRTIELHSKTRQEDNTTMTLLHPHRIQRIVDRAWRSQFAARKQLAASSTADNFRQTANEALKKGPFTVMSKSAAPPSGDKHDYMSQSPYWWPDPGKPDGLPYIRRDGEVNPERNQFDRNTLVAMVSTVETLALAAYLFDEPTYAEKAADLLNVFFLSPDTRMNPHLNFGQSVPGRATGRGVGIIETSYFVRRFFLDVPAILSESGVWQASEQQGFRAWFDAYLTWLLESDIARQEANAVNNHGSSYDLQVVMYTLFVGRDELAREKLQQIGPGRIAHQIEPDGRQLHELQRTRALNYSTLNLEFLCSLATIGQTFDIDIWRYKTPDGRNIRKAIEWMLPFWTQEHPWAYQQITPFEYERGMRLVRIAAQVYDDEGFQQIIQRQTTEEHLEELFVPGF